MMGDPRGEDRRGSSDGLVGKDVNESTRERDWSGYVTGSRITTGFQRDLDVEALRHGASRGQRVRGQQKRASASKIRASHRLMVELAD